MSATTAPEATDHVPLVMPELTDYPAIDVMNHLLEVRSGLAGNERLDRFMGSSRGRDKVMFGTNGFGLERYKTELLELDISEETKRAVLHDNAVRFLRLGDEQTERG